MKILIDIGHPAHVHLFKNFAREMSIKKHEVFFTCRNKEFEIHLLKVYGFHFHSFGKKYKSHLGKLWGLVKFDLLMLVQALKFKPDIFLSHGSIYAAHVAYLLNKPHIALEDTGNKEQVRLYLPFTKVVLSPLSFQHYYGQKHIFYNGFHELAYLGSSRFKPDPCVLNSLGINENEKYIIVRFVSYTATHDYELKTLTDQDKIKLIKSLPADYKVFISSEGKLPAELMGYAISIKPEMIHSALYYCSLFIGQSTTMAAEAAFLEKPSVFIKSKNQNTEGIIDNYDKYNIFIISDYSPNQVSELLLLVDELLHSSTDHIRDFMNNCIDVTGYLIWFMENYPDSFYKQKKDKTYPDVLRQKIG